MTIAREAAQHKTMATSLPAEMEEEQLAEGSPNLADVVFPADEVPSSMREGERQTETYQQLLEDIRLPGTPTEEAEQGTTMGRASTPCQGGYPSMPSGPGTCSEQSVEGYAKGKPVSEQLVHRRCASIQV